MGTISVDAGNVGHGPGTEGRSDGGESATSLGGRGREWETLDRLVARAQRPLSGTEAIDVTGMLVGRGREMCAIGARLSVVGERGGAVLVRGEAGVGKSVLLSAARHRAESAGMGVLAVSGARSEADVPFAVLHQLLQPLLRRAQGLPPPQRDALLATFGMDEASTPDPFLVALGSLELVAEEARKAPLLVIVDDAHWLDASTRDVLGFIARRLGPEPVVLLIAARDGYETAFVDFGLPELRVEALDDQSSRVLLDSHAPALEPELRGQVLKAAAGNPLALVELAVAAGSRPHVAFDPPERLPMTPRLQQALGDRYSHLPTATRAVLLIASADHEASLREVLTAAALIEKESPGLDALAPAVASGLVEHDHSRIRFRHQLLAAAVYQAATPAQRHAAHAALATTLVGHQRRRAGHRAASTTSPDEAVAAELERVSPGATLRGTPTITLAAMERAAELTPDPSRRRLRLLRAAELAVEFGLLHRASRILGTIDPSGGNALDRARIGLLRDMIEPGFPPAPKAVDQMIDAATLAASGGEIDLALRLLQAAAIHSWWADPGPDASRRVVAAAEQIVAPEGDLRALSIRAILDPLAAGTTLSEIAAHAAPDSCDPNTAYALGTALHATGAFEVSTTFLTAAVAGLRTQGRLRLLPQALAQQAWNTIYTGNWGVATSAAEEAATLARDTRQPMWEAAAKTALSMIAANRGDTADSESLLREAEGIALPLAARAVLADIQLVRALLALGDGRYDEAFQHLHRTFEPTDPAHHPVRSMWRIGEYAEAALRAGHVDQTREWLAKSEPLGQLASSTRLHIGLLYARPLLADENSAEPHFAAALAADLSRWPLYRARLLLEYGTWLRHRRRIAAARGPLRAARDAFDALGARPWAERARRELRASREARRQQPEARVQLTEQEQQIAHLAAQGLSNREIAQRLYMSHRTVGAHLYHIFPKLGISSRTHLAAAIGSADPPTRLAS